jgi:Zn-dependent protease with chaperone function
VIVAGTFFPGGSSRAIPAKASVEGKRLRISDEAGAVLAEFPLRKVRASSRLGNLMRRLELPDESRFETPDNDGIDLLLQERGRFLPGSMLHWLESSLQWVAVAVVIAGVSIFAMVRYGFPAGADWLAQRTPRPVAVEISRETLVTLDKIALSPSELPAAEQQRANRLFQRVAAASPQTAGPYHLIFRDAPRVGPNAFALPDGTVVMTDQLYPLVKKDDELEGVFGHEMAHVYRRHGLQMVYEASLLPAAIALITGDATQFGQIATVLPTMLVESSYSRGFEQQADDESARTMKRIGADPAALGALLERLDKEVCGKRGGCGPSWLGSHPATAARAARLRDEAKSH